MRPRKKPEMIDENVTEIEHFARHIHNCVLGKLLTLFAAILVLPDYFAARHRFGEALSDLSPAIYQYHARDAEMNAKLGNVWIKGHADFSNLALVFRQPADALRARANDDNWKW